MQEPFRKVISNFESMSVRPCFPIILLSILSHSTSIKTSQKVLAAASVLKIPIHSTTQNAPRLGPTVAELASLATNSLDKTGFSMLSAPGLPARLAPGRWTVALLGVEAHVCIAQTALALQRSGHDAVVLADGVGSVARGEVGLALERLAVQGGRVTPRGHDAEWGSITVMSSEAFLYEVMQDSAIPEFREVLKIVKSAAADTADAMAIL